nr:uncharacterized protein LOC124819386 [Hydra vulgaris]
MIDFLSPSCSNKYRKEKWEEVKTLVVAHGLSSDVTAEHIRTTEWQKLRRSTMKKFKRLKKSGAEGGQLSDYEGAILDTIRRESPYIFPVNVNDMRVGKKVLINKLTSDFIPNEEIASNYFVDIPVDSEILIEQDSNISNAGLPVHPSPSVKSIAKMPFETVPLALAARSIANNKSVVSTSSVKSSVPTKKNAIVYYRFR